MLWPSCFLNMLVCIGYASVHEDVFQICLLHVGMWWSNDGSVESVVAVICHAQADRHFWLPLEFCHWSVITIVNCFHGGDPRRGSDGPGRIAKQSHSTLMASTTKILMIGWQTYFEGLYPRISPLHYQLTFSPQILRCQVSARFS